jgi:hypothetical protein
MANPIIKTPDEIKITGNIGNLFFVLPSIKTSGVSDGF